MLWTYMEINGWKCFDMQNMPPGNVALKNDVERKDKKIKIDHFKFSISVSALDFFFLSYHTKNKTICIHEFVVMLWK